MTRIPAFAALTVFCFGIQAAENTHADLAKAKATAETVCVACHGSDGNSQTPANPILAGQHRDYLFKQLTEFKSTDGKPQVSYTITPKAPRSGSISNSRPTKLTASAIGMKPLVSLCMYSCLRTV